MRKRRRQRLLREPFPDAWEAILMRNVRHYRYLPAECRARLRDALRIFAAEKEWVGCGGLEMRDEIRVTIAGAACLLVLGVPGFYFDGVKSILVYPETYAHPQQRQAHGIVEEDVPISGEAWHRGPVVLAWRDVLRGVRNPHDGHNVVLHEFAHQLDGLDGEMGGSPPIADRDLAARWEQVFQGEYEQLVQTVQYGGPTLIDAYGATNRSEFFAVVTECFFELAEPLRDWHPELYDLLKAFYRVDPASWL